MLIFRRWIDRLGLGMVAAAIAILFLPYCSRVSDFIFPGSVSQSAWGVAVVGTVMLATIFVPLARSGVFAGFFGYKVFSPPGLRYPSLAWSVIFGSISLLMLERLVYAPSPLFTNFDLLLYAVPWFLGMLLVASACPVVWGFQRRLEHSGSDWIGDTHRIPERSGCSIADATLSVLVEDQNFLDAVIAGDEPIRSEGQDLFGGSVIAHRLLDALAVSDGATVGLLGRFGSGKSSIVNLAETHSVKGGNQKRYIFVRTPTWGVRPAALPLTLLRAGLRELSRVVDTTSLGGLPEAYVRAMEAALATWARPLVGLSASDPMYQLGMLDRVMGTIDMTMVFIVEDIDRNVVREELGAVYVEIQALLDQLRCHTNLSFVLCTGHTEIDFDRLCDIKLFVRPIPLDTVGAVVQAFRYRMLTEASERGILFPDRSALDIARLTKRLPREKLSLISDGGFRVDTSLPWHNILPLLSLPRRLKSALRSTKEAWERLQGEADFDQLLMCEVLRATSYSAVDAVTDIQHAKLNKFMQFSDERDEQLKEFETERIELATRNVGVHDLKHVKVLIKHLSGDDGLIMNDRRVQSLEVNEIYWQRIWTGQLVHSARPRDQTVLRQFGEWINEESSILIQSLQDDERFSTVFLSMLSRRKSFRHPFTITDENVLKLASEIYASTLASETSGACDDTCAGFYIPWQTIDDLGSSYESSASAVWLDCELKKALAVSLRFALDLYHRVDLKNHNERRRKLRTLIHDEIKAGCDVDQTFLASVCSCTSLSHVFTLAHLVLHEEFGRDGPYRASDWQWLIPHIQFALDAAPDIITPLVAGCALGGRYSGVEPEEGEGWNVGADLEAAKACVWIPNQGTRCDLFRRTLACLQKADASNYDPLTQAWVAEAIPTLSAWVEAGAPEPPPAAETSESTS